MVRLERDLPPDLAGRAELSAAETGRSRVERAQDGREGATRVLVPPAAPDPDVSERDFAQLVVDLATALGWTHFHVHDSRRSDPGWPDLVLAREGWLLFAELKTARGQLTREQIAWGQVLGAAGVVNARVRYYVWRPRDWGTVVWALTNLGATWPYGAAKED